MFWSVLRTINYGYLFLAIGWGVAPELLGYSIGAMIALWFMPKPQPKSKHIQKLEQQLAEYDKSVIMFNSNRV